MQQLASLFKKAISYNKNNQSSFFLNTSNKRGY